MTYVIVNKLWDNNLSIYAANTAEQERAALLSILNYYMEDECYDEDDSPIVGDKPVLREPMVRLRATPEEVAKAEALMAAAEEKYAVELERWKAGVAWHRKRFDEVPTEIIWFWLTKGRLAENGVEGRVTKEVLMEL